MKEGTELDCYDKLGTSSAGERREAGLEEAEKIESKEAKPFMRLPSHHVGWLGEGFIACPVKHGSTGNTQRYSRLSTDPFELTHTAHNPSEDALSVTLKNPSA